MEIKSKPTISSYRHNSIPTYYCGDGSDWQEPIGNIITTRYRVSVDVEFINEDLAKTFCNSVEAEIARYSKDD